VPSLAELQELFLKSVVSKDENAAHDTSSFVSQGERLNPRRRLEIYRANIQATHMKALRDIYPVAEKLVGKDYFNQIARGYILQNPSKEHDLNLYGARFTEFVGEVVAQRPEATSLAYLPDVVKLEWSYHRAHYTLDEPLFDPHSLGSIPSEQWGTLQFSLSESLSLFYSLYPIFEIFTYHQGDMKEELVLPDMAEPQHIAVWRRGMVPKIEVLSRANFERVDALQNGSTLLELGNSFLHPEEMTEFLSDSIEKGWIVGIS